MTENLRMAVTFVLSYIDELAHVNIPGTSVPFVVLFLSPAVIIVLWKFMIQKFFGGE